MTRCPLVTDRGGHLGFASVGPNSTESSSICLPWLCRFGELMELPGSVDESPGSIP